VVYAFRAPLQNCLEERLGISNWFYLIRQQTFKALTTAWCDRRCLMNLSFAKEIAAFVFLVSLPITVNEVTNSRTLTNGNQFIASIGTIAINDTIYEEQEVVARCRYLRTESDLGINTCRSAVKLVVILRSSTLSD
jgi:hypothetical protein